MNFKPNVQKFLAVLLFFITTMAFSQTGEVSVSGKVTDEKGIALAGATVMVKSSKKGVSTDLDGNYRIQAPLNSVLEVTFVGFKTESKKVVGGGNSLIINFLLKEEIEQLDDVVVVGYGSAKKIASTVGVVTQINTKGLAEMPSINVIDGMQGKVAGLQVFTSSGEPAALSSIQLHGMGSFDKKNDVLIILDGFPISTAGFRSLNPNDFESVTILKDASATSIYGSRASNGVMYITTKRGKTGKSQISLTTQYGVSNIANKKPFDNLMSSTELARFWVETGRRTQEQIDDLFEEYNADTQWYKVYFRESTPFMAADLSLSGGNEKTRYFLSSGYTSQDGIMYGSKFERLTVRSNIDTQAYDWLRVGLNMGVAYYDNKENPYSVRGDGQNQDLEDGTMGYMFAPFYPTVDKNGKRLDYLRGVDRYHPEYLAEKFDGQYLALEFMPSGFAEITPFKNFKYRIQGGIQFNNRMNQNNQLPSYLGDENNGTASRVYTRYLQKSITNTLEYKLGIDNHHITALLGQEAFSTSYITFRGRGAGLTNDNLLLLSHTTNNEQVTENRTFSITRSYFGRMEYNYDNRYFLDTSVRTDGSSKFGPKHKWGNFWSAGLMWRAKSESFLQNVDFIDDLNMKFSVGTMGNSDIGEYEYVSLVSPVQYNGKAGWINTTESGNPELTWEKQTKYMLSMDARLFNTLSIDLEMYNRITTDMLMDTPNPYTSGFARMYRNIGKIQNKGIGVTISVDAFRNKDAYITPYFSINYNQEKILELYDDVQNWPVGNYSLMVGKPMMYYYPLLKGVNPQTGENEWYLPSNDPTVTTRDENRVTSVYNQEALEQNSGYRINPPVAGGFGVSASYKAFSLQADFSYFWGKYLLNNDKYFLYNPTLYEGDTKSLDVLDYWKNPGDVTRFPKFGTQFQQFDSGLLEDASFIRLKNIMLAYSLPQDVLQEVGFFNRIRFFVTGRNLLTLTKYTGIDPENNGSLAHGAYPNTKQYVFGVELKF